MSNIDKIMIECLTQDLKKAKSIEQRKQIMSEINEIKSNDMMKKCLIIGLLVICVLGALNGISQKFNSIDTEVFKEASWYQE